MIEILFWYKITFSKMKLERVLCKTSLPFLNRFLHAKPRKERNVSWIRPSGVETGIEVYNPITKCNTPLILNNKQIVTWYMCGPTLYDSAHIGHACTYVRFDIIQRILNDFFGLHVVQVMGLTDIDDKIIQRSAESNQDWKQLTKIYEKEFFEDMNSLNVTKPYLSCRVTDYIPHIVDFVTTLLEKNNAYATKDGSVYFDTLKYTNYGKFSQPEADSNHPDKKSSLDFALWKSSKPGEPIWECSWGHGRPGWHIECSAIASATLGKSIDIHSGGIDLMFPHHENEEAQSCSYHDNNQWVNYWLHTGHLHLTGDEKMSKSLKNTISIQKLLEQYTANEFRMLCLLTAYRHGIEFSSSTMQNAVSKVKKIEHFLQDCDNYVAGILSSGSVDGPLLLSALHETEVRVLNALRDDFDTPKAIHEISELIAIANKMLHGTQNQTKARNTVAIAGVSKYISTVLLKLGISNSTNAKGNQYDVESVIENFVKFRSVVRNKALNSDKKNLELLEACDLIRKDLSIHGIDIKDYKGKSTWTIVKK